MEKLTELSRVTIRKRGRSIVIQRSPIDEDCDYLEIMLQSGKFTARHLITRFEISVAITDDTDRSDIDIVIVSHRIIIDGRRTYDVLIRLEDEEIILVENCNFPYNRSSFKRTVGGITLEVIEG